MGEVSGRCACGAVRYVCDGPILWAGHCHCESCRRASSAPVVSFLGVRRDCLEWAGQMVDVLTSGGSVRRQFCAACKSIMTYQNETWPDETHLFAATLDDPAQFEPLAHYHWAERVSWFHCEDNLPKHPASADG